MPGTTLTPEVLWRPGCPFCLKLRVSLRVLGVQAEWRNIWEDDAARALVREHNGGDETVPTVRVGERWLTNPSAREVRRLARG